MDSRRFYKEEGALFPLKSRKSKECRIGYIPAIGVAAPFSDWEQLKQF